MNEKIIVILPTYRESKSLRSCVEEFLGISAIDHIIVVNNNAEPGTSDAIPKNARVTEIFEVQQGYGSAIRAGTLFAASQFPAHNYFAICEPDGTFIPRDIIQLHSFSSEVDIVFGSRTVSSFIWTGANMGAFLRWGNWLWAKIIEVLFNTVYLSDVGCTFRILNRSVLIELNLNGKYLGSGSTYGLDMMLWSAALKKRMVQIPVNYRPRIGSSSVTGSYVEAFKLGLHMLARILLRRIIGTKAWNRG